jgi:aryl-alcohol dehydrogenase-like predicted oxidoreductase
VKLGLGLAALGRPGYMTLGHAGDFADRSPEAMERQTHAVLDEGWARGVRAVDAARSYGRAEEFLASWLNARAIQPGTIAISSKWGYRYTAGWRAEAEKHEVKDHSLSAFEEQWPESEALLGPWLSIYQIHSVTADSPALGDGALMAALSSLRERGVTVGLTLSGPQQAEVLRRALEVRLDGVPLFGAVQATWNLHERSAEPALAEAHARGLTVIVKEALANGRLTTRGDFGPLRAIAVERGVGPDAIALAAAMAQPWADRVLTGAATTAQLAENLRALAVSWDASLAEAVAPLVEPPELYWRTRGKLAWT